MFAYGAGNAIQAGLENANGGMVSAVGKAATVFRTTRTATQKVNANQVSQGLGYTAAGKISDVISHQNIHASGMRSGSKPGVKRAIIYTRAVKSGSSTWTQQATFARYSYMSIAYHTANPLYNYSVFSASNGYYMRSSGGVYMSRRWLTSIIIGKDSAEKEFRIYQTTFADINVCKSHLRRAISLLQRRNFLNSYSTRNYKKMPFAAIR